MSDNQKGFTLLEILIALTLSSFLLMGIYQIFSSSLQHVRMQSALAEIQENARTALWILQQNLRDTGYIGCRRVSPAFTVMQQVQQLSYLPKMLQGEFVYGYWGHDNEWFPDLPNDLRNKVADNTDVIVIEKSHLAADLTTAMLSSDGIMTLNKNTLFETGDVAVISDCMHADLFYITHLQNQNNEQIVSHESPENISAYLQKVYVPPAQVSRWTVQAFYIGETARQNSQQQPIYGLYQQGLLPTASRVEMIEGVINMRVLYGVTNIPNDPVMQWVTADQLSPAWFVVGVSIILLLQSNENVLDTPQSYQWLEETIIANDKRLYRVFHIDIALRNTG